MLEFRKCALEVTMDSTKEHEDPDDPRPQDVNHNDGFPLFFLHKHAAILQAGGTIDLQSVRISLRKEWDSLCPTGRLVYQKRCAKLSFSSKPMSAVKQIWDASCQTAEKSCEGLKCDFYDLSPQVLFRSEASTKESSDEELIGKWDKLSKAKRKVYEIRCEKLKKTFLEGIGASASSLEGCPDCGKVFPEKDELISHVWSAHRFMCKSCYAVFPSENVRRTHWFREHFRHPLWTRKCEFCDKLFPWNMDKIHDHVIRDHFSAIGLSADDPLVQTRKTAFRHFQNRFKGKDKAVDGNIFMKHNQTCHDCQITFDTLQKLKYHRMKTHGKWRGSLACEECGKEYGTQSNLKRHVKQAHGAGVPKPERKHECTECGQSFLYVSHLKIHARKHTGERPFPCDKCSFGFFKKSDLNHHAKSCKGVKYCCDQCQTTFHFKKQLLEHALWSESCGSMKEKAAFDEAQGQPEAAAETVSKGRYMDRTPNVIRFNFDGNESVIVINSNDLAENEEMFVKRKKKSKCGFCDRCERVDDCGRCEVCLKPSDESPPPPKKRSKTTKSKCLLRQCLSLLEQYDVKKEHQTYVASTLGLALSSKAENAAPEAVEDVLRDRQLRLDAAGPA